MAALLVSRARNMFLSSTPSSSSSRRYSPPVPFSRRRRLGRFPIPPPWDNSCAGIRTQASSSSSPSSRSSSGTERKEKEEKHHELEKTNFKKGRGLDVDVRPHRYEEELREKISKAVAVLLQKRIKTTPTLLSSSGNDGSNNIEIFKSKQTNGGFRMRAVFGVHLDGPIDARYSMVEVLGTSTLPSGKIYKEKKTVLVDSFPMGSDAMRAAMPSVRSLVERDDANLRRRLFQVEFLTATSGDVVVTMCYHRKLDEEWVKAAEGMREEMNRMHPELNVSIVGRANRMRKVIGNAFVMENVHLDGTVLKYKQLEGQFAQPNAQIATEMLKFARSCCAPSSNTNDFLELYCGNGHFTVALSPFFRTCLSTEISKTNIAAARENIEMNGIKNTHVVRLSAEEVVQAIDGERVFTRLKDTQLDLTTLNIKTVLVDPPRAGCGPEVSKMLQRFENIVYISCNVETLAEDMLILSETHDMKRFAVFDQFPYTPHLECGAYLVKKCTGS
jgi:tRNA (uracil-5-)-methyltransferase